MHFNKYLAKKNYKALILTSFFLTISCLASFVFEGIETYNEHITDQQQEMLGEANNDNESTFTIYTMSNDPRPFMQLVTLLFSFTLFISLFITKRFLLPAMFSFLGFLIYFFWQLDHLIRYLTYNHNYSKSFLDAQFAIGNYFDHISTIGFTFILFWQISILFRILNNNKLTKELLP